MYGKSSCSIVHNGKGTIEVIFLKISFQFGVLLYIIESAGTQEYYPGKKGEVTHPDNLSGKGNHPTLVHRALSLL